MPTTSIRIPDDLMAKLESTAEKMRRSKSWLINDAVREYVDKQEKQQIEDNTRAALADIKAGRLVDGQPVMEWLSSWGTAKEQTASQNEKNEKNEK